jgi:hypothetical protein
VSDDFGDEMAADEAGTASYKISHIPYTRRPTTQLRYARTGRIRIVVNRGYGGYRSVRLFL